MGIFMRTAARQDPMWETVKTDEHRALAMRGAMSAQVRPE